MISNLVKFGLAALLALVATPFLPLTFAQVEQGTITGTVTDSSGASHAECARGDHQCSDRGC